MNIENMETINANNAADTIQSIEDLPPILHVADLIPLLDLSRNTVYGLVRCGKIRSVKIGRLYRIPREAVEEFLSGRTTAA